MSLAKSVGGAGAASPLTTKGDLYTFSTVDIRLPIGADGNALMADSTEATGLKWVTVFESYDMGSYLDDVDATSATSIDMGAY